MRRPLLACLTALVLLAPSSAGAVTGGSPDGGAHPYVAFVGDPVTRNICTGTLISPTLLVTAAHCSTTGSMVLVGPGENGPSDGLVPGIFTAHPRFCGECGNGLVGFATYDVAVVQLLVPVRLPRYASLPAYGAAAGKSDVTVSGYGVHGFERGGGKPQPFGDLTRFSATAELTPAAGKLTDEFVRLRLNHGGICMGDSGGPLLRGDTVLAVNSFLASTNTCAGVGYAYRLDTPAAQTFVRAFQ